MNAKIFLGFSMVIGAGCVGTTDLGDAEQALGSTYVKSQNGGELRSTDGVQITRSIKLPWRPSADAENVGRLLDQEPTNLNESRAAGLGDGQPRRSDKPGPLGLL